MPEDLRWNAATLWAGPKCHIVHYPLSGWKVFNLVVTYHNDAPEPVAGKPVSHEDEVMRASATSIRAPRTSSATAPTGSSGCLCDRDPVERWVDGRVALLGDAAHPMLQYFAQGACHGDGGCGLPRARWWRSIPASVGTALERYRQQRVLRTARVQLQSRAIGEHIYHPANAHALLRNATLRAMSPADMYDNLAWLYGGSGLSDDPVTAAGATVSARPGHA